MGTDKGYHGDAVAIVQFKVGDGGVDLCHRGEGSRESDPNGCKKEACLSGDA